MHISKSQLEGIMRTYINNSDHVRNKSDKKTPEGLQTGEPL